MQTLPNPFGMPEALDGVRVLDCSQILAGPFCSMLLADMGADVIKIEKPNGGDDTRRMGPPFIDTESAAFLAMNRNKRSVVLNFKEEAGIEAMKKLVEDADIVIENYRTGVMERLGLSYEDLKAINPGIIYCSISGFGRTGPYARRGGYDLIAQAMSGIMSFTGVPDTPPVKAGVPIADMNAGMFSVYGILSAYIHKLKTGNGQYLEISLLEAALAYTVWESAGYFATGEVAEPLGSSHRNSAPYQALETSDGYIVVGAPNQPNWERLANAFGCSDLIAREEYKDNAGRLVNRAKLEEELEIATTTKTTDEWLVVLEEAGVPAGPILNMEQIWADPQVQDRGMEAILEHPTAGAIKNIGTAAKLYATPGRITKPAPLLGQHTREVLLGMGYTADEIDALVESGAAVTNDI
ncbi:MAG: CoA transferase [Dehalococcoidia bacterium]|jgi:formyl-CoA transferase|nr:CoA transferase [Dehalococcoidia bacterium]|tara:strand:+ start:2486 stop:3715 length:1230 start_codon:yes stop_codon:yes gene_type:complete